MIIGGGGGDCGGCEVFDVGIGEGVGDCGLRRLSISSLVNPFSCRNAVFWSSGALWRSLWRRNSEAAFRMEDLFAWGESDEESVGGDGISNGPVVCVFVGSSFCPGLGSAGSDSEVVLIVSGA